MFKHWIIENCYFNAKVYTKIPGTLCDGWAYTSLEDCKKKCINNELPSSPCVVGKPTNGCKYVFYKGWGGECQLAEDGCMTQSEYNSSFNSYNSWVVWEKPGKDINIQWAQPFWLTPPRTARISGLKS